MNRAARQCAVVGVARHMHLVSQLALNQRGLARTEVGQHHRHGFFPPGQTAQVRLLQVKVAPGQVHAGQHRADQRAVLRAWLELAGATQALHHGGRFALEFKHQVALLVGAGLGHRHIMLRQVFHQSQIKRQLHQAEAFEQREYQLPALPGQLGGDKVVGVLDAACAALQRAQFAQAKLLHERAGLLGSDLGVDRHAA